MRPQPHLCVFKDRISWMRALYKMSEKFPINLISDLCLPVPCSYCRLILMLILSCTDLVQFRLCSLVIISHSD